jgi:hypothetical protein
LTSSRTQTRARDPLDAFDAEKFSSSVHVAFALRRPTPVCLRVVDFRRHNKQCGVFLTVSPTRDTLKLNHEI